MSQAHQTTMLAPDMPVDEVVVETAAAPAAPQGTLADMEEDADLMVQYSPTLAARAWRLVIIGGSRAANWAWEHARRRTPGSRGASSKPTAGTGGDTTP
jgi:hypothetical protein